MLFNCSITGQHHQNEARQYNALGCVCVCEYCMCFFGVNECLVSYIFANVNVYYGTFTGKYGGCVWVCVSMCTHLVGILGYLSDKGWLCKSGQS